MFLVNMPEPNNHLPIFMTSEVIQTSPQQVTDQEMYAQDSNTYIPPNYGGPDSQYGSGTR
ncbi:hypothetical protein H6G73_18410 [Richelia sinica FACHB-800]|nr:hypothetical protein [Richelia sinica FACHB-800]